MKNLIKNVVRSFKRNKISIIGLVFLLFFGLGAFCIMSNTTHNIKSEYTSLAKQGKLHDFTAAELYDVGNASYAPQTKGLVYTVDALGDVVSAEAINDWTEYPDEHITTNFLYTGVGLGTEVGTNYYCEIPEQTIFDSERGHVAIRTYHIKLDAQTSTGLYKSFADAPSDPKYVDFYVKVSHTYETTIPENVRNYQTILGRWDNLQPGDSTALATYNFFHDDFEKFSQALNNQTQTIYNIMTTTNTKLSLYLDQTYPDEVEHRLFKSINVTGTKDNIFYKIIESNPTDTIDKMVLFADKAERSGNYLFNNNDWAPYGSEIEFYDLSGNPVQLGSEIDTGGIPEKLYIPEDFNEVAETELYHLANVSDWTNSDAKFVYSQILQVRFKRMMSGYTTDPDARGLIQSAAATNLDATQYYEQLFGTSTLQKVYEEYLSGWYEGGGESITISANGNVVFSWTAIGTPQTCTISNWTSRFAIVNPQHLEKNNKYVLNPSQLNDFKPYKEWYKATYGGYPSGEISQERTAAWFNSLTSDQFGFWIDPYTKEEWSEMAYSIPGWENPLIVGRGKESGQWNGIPEQYISSCGGFNEIIWGCGLTPDFMYPVVDISRPTPNTKTESLVYCNNAGYNSIKLAFVTSTVEEYLLARFKPNVNTNRRHVIVDSINEWAKTNMIFPEGVKCAYFADDTSNVLNCSGFRIAYLPHLVNVVETVSNVLCTFIGILCLIICFVIIKRYVEGNRVNIGIMRANGIKKWKIGVSLLPFALLPAIIGGVGAYLLGLFLQPVALNLFSSYWMLPTPLLKFDWVSFLSCIFVPFIVFSIICFVTTMIVLRVRTVDLMKPGSEFKTNAFSRVVKKPFKHFGVMTRFRVSLAFNSITRLLMLAAMSCLTMSSLVFAFTTFDKLSKSRETNSSQFKYSFNLELTTPTTSGSSFNTFDYYTNNATNGFGYSDPSHYIFNTMWNTSNSDYATGHEWYTQDGVQSYHQLTKWYSRNTISLLFGDTYVDAIGKNGNLFLPNAGDSSGQDTDLLYLQNRFSSKLTLDHVIGLPGVAASNPWEIALALMPSNSRNIASDSFNQIINIAGHKINEATIAWLDRCVELGVPPGLVHYETSHVADDGYGTYTEQVHQAANEAGPWMNIFYENYEEYWGNNFNAFVAYDDKSDTYYLINDITVIGQLFSGFNDAFISFIKTIYTDPDLMRLEYPIVYGPIPLNWGITEGEDIKLDETYTYVQGDMYRRGTHEVKIEGIQDNSQYIYLTDKKGHRLNDRLFDQNYLDYVGVDEDVYPIIVNAYAAHKYHFKEGQIVEVDVTNTADRFEQVIHPERYSENANRVKFKVVGISQGTNNEAYYTSQRCANDILGLPDGESWNKTHKYMTWAESSNARQQIVDLAGIDSEETTNTRLYSFDSAQSTFPQAEDGLPKLNYAVPIGFNGIYTQNKEGKPLTAGLSLYSYTGLYPGASVYKSAGENNKFQKILSYGANLAIANLLVGGMEGVPSDLDLSYYAAYQQHVTDPTWTGYPTYINSFIEKLTDVFGDTTLITAIAGAMDVAASDLVYSNLIDTFNLAETSIMAIIIPITIIIVAVISNLIINDSKKMAAMMKALGYSDSKNLMSILALFIPTIVVGLALAVPLSLGLTLGYQSIIFNTANILVDVTQKWWFYVAAVGGIGVILIGTYGIGFVSLKRDRLVDRIK